MATTLHKKTIPHIRGAQKRRLKKGPVKFAYAKYDEIKSVLSEYTLPKDTKNVLIVFAELDEPRSKRHKGPSLKDELKDLGFKALPKQEIELGRFKVPVPTTKQRGMVQEIQKLLEVNQEDLANIIGCSPRKIWSILNKKGEFFKTKAHTNNFNQLVSLINQLLSIEKKETLKEWLKSPQEVFKKKKPIDLLISGRIDLLFRWAYMQLEGQYK